MFDFRYHVVSLAAVFIALVLGVLVGIGLSGKGFVNDAERENLSNQIDALRGERNQARTTADAATTRLLALQTLVDEAFEPLVKGRLLDKRIVVLSIGEVGEASRAAVRAVQGAARGKVVMRSLGVPIDPAGLQRALAGKPQLKVYVGEDRLEDIARGLAGELVNGGPAPLWNALASQIVAEQSGSLGPPVDAVVVARSAKPQQGPTKDFLSALYAAISRTGVPAVGVQEVGVTVSPIPVFRRAGLSTVDSVDSTAGSLSLVLVLAGAERGHYGVEDTATDGIVPPLDSLPG
jgi:hypothetical protein